MAKKKKSLQSISKVFFVPVKQVVQLWGIAAD